MDIHEGASLRYLNTFRLCKKQLDAMGSQYVNNLFASRELRTFRDVEVDGLSEETTLVVTPMVVDWKTVIVDESNMQGYIGLDIASCLTLKVEHKHTYEDYLRFPVDSWQRRIVQFYLGHSAGETVSDDQIQRDFEELEKKMVGITKKLQDEVEYRIMPSAKGLITSKPEYLPLILLDFGKLTKRVISFDKRGTYMSPGMPEGLDWKDFVYSSFRYHLRNKTSFPWGHIQVKIGKMGWNGLVY